MYIAVTSASGVDQEGRVLRIEIVVVKSPRDLGLQQRLVNLSQLVARARARNRRLLEQERVGTET